MRASLAVVAGDRERGLAAPPSRVAETVAPGSDAGSDAVVVLGDWEAADGAVHIRWCDEAAGDAPAGSERRIATAGTGLWRRAPWPAADALFELADPSGDAGVVVAGGDSGRRASLTAAVGARGIAAEEEPLLEAGALERAAAVVLLPSERAPQALALEAMAVLAAGRLLLVPRTDTAFGLMPGIDHLQFTLAPEAADLLESARNHPGAFASMRAWGRFAAGRHRASNVYSALVADLELEGALPGK